MAQKPRSRRKGRVKLADRADRHDLYQRSVQYPPADVEFFLSVWKKRRRRAARTLREDFCGTAHLASTWVRGHRNRRAVAVDLDAATLEWGRAHNVDAGIEKRIRLVCADVLDVARPRVDITCALNFSYCVFKRREQLLRYFRTVHRGLVQDGIFFCEIYGGTEAVVELEEAREVDGFTYVWEQASFDPVTHETVCHIHFRFRDGSAIERAFTYDWRLWTVPELRDLLLEAGFSNVSVYWEEVDEDGDGTGEYRIANGEENQESWLVYLAAEK